MCCGTAQNSYHTLAGMRLVLADDKAIDEPALVMKAVRRLGLCGAIDRKIKLQNNKICTEMHLSQIIKVESVSGHMTLTVPPF